MAEYTVSTEDSAELVLCEDETVASVLQNVRLLLATRKGSVPFYRDFGLDMSFLDKPINQARVYAVRAVKNAIEEFEPRAAFVSSDISYTSDGKMNVKAVITIE